ncbi:hypothetical protein [Mesorhizobium sp. M4A.F.Ca.ET.090.04.2.1]|uniref:hypothetical protein n=1 Tax=Mesorhizobium sp. M4A.F.Ca.ET.090.04.2.1 TaxID=2496663 RepID=UPI001678C572|nr:hypothetical protein [Mesorhizobium sp. M4A.F.Ca.ET.090.04.2.1]
MKTDCLAILMAIDSQADFLRGLFGRSDAPAPKPAELPKFTPAVLFSMAPRRVLRPP